MQLSKHTFLITGGASGLGAATAAMLVEAGANVGLIDLNAAALQQQVSALGAQARGYVADIADEQQADNAVNAAFADLGPLHGLINCAGIAPGEKVLGRNGPHALASFERTLRINLLGSFNMLRLVTAVMAEGAANADGERGVIINTASVAAFDGQIGQAAYSASKGGVVGMTLPIARDLGPLGIRVMTIAPGIMDTPLLDAAPPELKEALGKIQVFPQRLGTAEEFAHLVLTIVENQMLNGEVIRLDAGARMPPK